MHNVHKVVKNCDSSWTCFSFLFTDYWTSTYNQQHVDFNIFNNLEDARSGVNYWTYLDFDDPDVGFPRNSGHGGWTPNEWFSMPGGSYNIPGVSSGAGFSIYTWSNCPSPVGGNWRVNIIKDYNWLCSLLQKLVREMTTSPGWSWNSLSQSFSIKSRLLRLNAIHRTEAVWTSP